MDEGSFNRFMLIWFTCNDIYGSVVIVCFLAAGLFVLLGKCVTFNSTLLCHEIFMH